MNYGFVKVGAAVPLLKVGDCSYNIEQTQVLMQRAEDNGVQMLCFPEMGVTGYTCGDLFHQKVLIEQAEASLKTLIEATSELSLLTVVGMPVPVQNRLMNTAVVFQKGKILAVIPKTWLPNYGEFYEKRWFSSARQVDAEDVCLCGQNVPFGTEILFKSGEACLGIEICEDLWMPIPPSSYHALRGANILFNLSASNELIAKNDYRKQLIAQQSSRCIAAYVYASAGFGESSTDVVFAGNAEIAENGSPLVEAERFSLENQLIVGEVDVERLNGDRLRHTGFTADFLQGFNSGGYRVVSFDLKEMPDEQLTRTFSMYPFVPQGVELDNRCREMYSIQVQGLVKRLVHTGCKHVVIGISGGLDSTLALLVAVKAFDKLGISRVNIEGITMPGFGTTGRTYNNALDLMKALGVHSREISIVKAVNQHFEDIGHDPSVHNVTYENSQARERTQILMDVANQMNGLVIGTGDLSELALGWATYNGDHMSMYGVNVGIPKTLVRFMVNWIAGNQMDQASATILKDVIDTPVSPELLPADADGQISQKTEDLVGPYALHDFVLYHVLRFGFQPRKIRWMAVRAFAGTYDSNVIDHWLRVFYKRFFAHQFKRSCLPDGPKVGSVSLSPRGDWRMPSDAVAKIWLEDL
jgi:NAD+ synthase (glutamine-hydrolysing)